MGCSYADVNLRRPADLPVHHSSESAQGTALPYCSTGRTTHASGPVAGMHACMRLRGKCVQASASECARLSAYRHVRRWATQWSSWMDLLRASGRPRGRLHWRRGIGSAAQHKTAQRAGRNILQLIATQYQRVAAQVEELAALEAWDLYIGLPILVLGKRATLQVQLQHVATQYNMLQHSTITCCNTVQHVAIQYSRVWHRAPLRHANVLDEGSGRRAQEEVSTGFQDGVHEGGSKGRSARGSTYQRKE